MYHMPHSVWRGVVTACRFVFIFNMRLYLINSGKPPKFLRVLCGRPTYTWPYTGPCPWHVTPYLRYQHHPTNVSKLWQWQSMHATYQIHTQHLSSKTSEKQRNFCPSNLPGPSSSSQMSTNKDKYHQLGSGRYCSCAR